MAVESAAHVHATSMRHIPTPELLRAFDLGVPGLAEVSAAVGAGDCDAGARALRAHLAARPGPAAYPDMDGWIRAVPGTPAEKEVLAAADEVAERAVDFTDPAHGRSGLYALHYLDWVRPLVSAFACTRSDRYVAAWVRHFSDWYASRDQVRGEWPGLDVVWYTLGVAARSSVISLALRTFAGAEALPLPTFLDMLRAVVGGARWLHEEHDTFRHGNWQVFGCAELLHVTSVLPDLRESAAWRERASARLTEHLDLDVYPDGGHLERAPGYHVLCLEAYAKAAVAGAASGWDVTAHPQFAAMYDWLATLASETGWVPPFNDSPVVWVGAQLLRGEQLLGHAARPPSPRCSRLLPTSKFAVLRGGGAGEELYATLNFGPRVGHELHSHSHAAALDVVLVGWGDLLAGEAGGPSTYDDPAYLGWYQATRAHSTVVVDSRPLRDEHDGKLLRFATSPVLDIVSASHAGYAPATHTRTLVFVRPGRLGPGYWVLHDELDSAEAFTWMLHGRSPWLVGDDGMHRSEAAPGMVVAPVEAAAISCVTTDAGPACMPDGATRTTVRSTLHALQLHAVGGELTTVLVPFEASAPHVGVRSLPSHVAVTVGDVVDHHGRGWWVRDRGTHGLAAAVWGRPVLEHGGRVLLSASPLEHAALTVGRDRIEATVEVSASTVLTVGCRGARAVWLDGVGLRVDERDGVVSVPLPYAGGWHVRIEHEALAVATEEGGP